MNKIAGNRPVDNRQSTGSGNGDFDISDFNSQLDATISSLNGNGNNDGHVTEMNAAEIATFDQLNFDIFESMGISVGNAKASNANVLPTPDGSVHSRAGDSGSFTITDSKDELSFMGLSSPALTSTSPLFFANSPSSLPSPTTHPNLTSPVMPQMAYRTTPQLSRPRKRQATDMAKKQLQHQSNILQQTSMNPSPQMQAQMQAHIQAQMNASMMSPSGVSMAHHQALLSPAMSATAVASAEQLRQLAQRQQIRRAMSANLSPGSPLVHNVSNSPQQSPLMTAQQMNQMMTSPMLDGRIMSPTSVPFQQQQQQQQQQQLSAAVVNATAASSIHPITPSVLMHLQHEKTRLESARSSPLHSPVASPRIDASNGGSVPSQPMARSGSGPGHTSQQIKLPKATSTSTPSSPVVASKRTPKARIGTPTRIATDPKSPMPAFSLSTAPRDKGRAPNEKDKVNANRRRSSILLDGIPLPSPTIRRDSAIPGPSPHINPREAASPLLQPRLESASPNIAAELTAKSNYQAILEGKHKSLGLNFSTDLPDALTQRRSTHKEAEQKRRDGLKAWFDALRKVVPGQSPSLGEGTGDDDGSDEDDQRSDKEGRKKRPGSARGWSKLECLQRTYEYVVLLQEELKKKDALIDQLQQNKTLDDQDAKDTNKTQDTTKDTQH